mgnify:CR=1 FL=1
MKSNSKMKKKGFMEPPQPNFQNISLLSLIDFKIFQNDIFRNKIFTPIKMLYLIDDLRGVHFPRTICNFCFNIFHLLLQKKREKILEI